MPVEPRVTAVIPAWGEYTDGRLDEAIASLRGQDAPVEILLVDNAHEPPLEREAARVVRSDRRLTLGATRNLGLDSVTTPYVLFWDADDLMPPGTLGRLAREMDGDARLVACAAAVTDATTGSRHHWPRRWPLLLCRWPRAFATVNAVSSLFPVTGALLRTRMAREARFPDSDGGDDWVMGVSVAFRGRVAVLRSAGRIYRRHPGSVSARWGTRDALQHCTLVRRRLREDPAVPGVLRRCEPAFALTQALVLIAVRPVARRTPRRRRAGA